MEIILIFIFVSYIFKIVASHIILQKRTGHISTKNPLLLDKKIKEILLDKHIFMSAASLISIGLLSTIDIIYAKKILTAQEAGLYSAWNLFGKIITYILGPIVMVALVFFSTKKYQQYHRLVFLFVFGAMTVIGVIFYLFYTIFGQWAINLIFGLKYISIYHYLGLAALYGTSYLMVLFLNSYFLAKESKAIYIVLSLVLIYTAILFLMGKTLYDVMYVTTAAAGIIIVIPMLYTLIATLKNRNATQK
jgi:O-antigen/teichoic acid export membrane protein